MRQVADNLRKQVYINSSSVDAIRKYIRVKNPGYSDRELGAVFADAIHKVIDARIHQFEEKHRRKIRTDVIKRAAVKQEFSINAAEVLSSCLSVRLREEGYIESLAQWINQSQPVAVSVAEVDRLVSEAAQFDGESPQFELERIIDAYEESGAVEGLAEIQSKAHDEYRMLVDNQEVLWIEQIEEFVRGEAAAGLMVVEQSEAIEGQETLKFGLRYPGRLALLKAELTEMAGESLKRLRLFVRLVVMAAIPLAVIAVAAITLLTGERVQELRYKGVGRYAVIEMEQMDRYLTTEARMIAKLGGAAGEGSLIVHDGLHEDYRFEAVDEEKLRSWLEKRNSILSEEPYFTAIFETSRKYDIHPALMFAIVGQEQGFVPRSSSAARKIANNPFNVYGSWEKYNTDIYDSSRLAAGTIIESSRNRPAYINSIKWINRRYAEDPNWWNGVSSLFAQIKKEMTNF